jgi:hypothetical protein
MEGPTLVHTLGCSNREAGDWATTAEYRQATITAGLKQKVISAVTPATIQAQFPVNNHQQMRRIAAADNPHTTRTLTGTCFNEASVSAESVVTAAHQ